LDGLIFHSVVSVKLIIEHQHEVTEHNFDNHYNSLGVDNAKEEEKLWKSKNLQDCIMLRAQWMKRRISLWRWPPCWHPGAAHARLRASRPRSKPAPVVKNALRGREASRRQS
jgi:hypothetical protein